MSLYITYAHKDEPNGARYKQLACDPLPAWAIDVSDCMIG
jgi:hypothetical protein